MITQAEVDRLYDCEVIDEHGERIGSVKQVWLDDRDGRPMWASVHTGLLGLTESFVPIQDAELRNRTVRVHVDKQQVKDAPRVDVSDQHMSEAQQEALYSYYGLISSHRSGEHDRLSGSSRANPADRDQAGTGPTPTTGGVGDPEGSPTEVRGRHEAWTGDSITDEEDVEVVAREVEGGRVRLVKHVVTDHGDASVPVTHEEVRVIREPAEATGRPSAERHAVTGQQVGGPVRPEEVDVERDDRA